MHPASRPIVGSPPVPGLPLGWRVLPAYNSPMAITPRSSTIGPASRPVAVPEDFVDHRAPKAAGCVELPPHVRRSGPPVIYDLDDAYDRRRVHEQVLREGTEDDVRFYGDANLMLEEWDELLLPTYVRDAWSGWIEQHRESR